MKEKKADRPRARDLVKAFPAPPLDREALNRALKSACRNEKPEFAEAPVRTRRSRSSCIDAHFYEFAAILLPDPKDFSLHPRGRTLSLQDVSEAFKKNTGLTLHPSSIARYLESHPTLKRILK